MKIKIATVVPNTKFGVGSEVKNLGMFTQHLASAKELGADIVIFPESYPDNWSPPTNSSLLAEFSKLSKKFSLHFIAGLLETSDENNTLFYNTSVLFDDLGNEIGRYRRTTPNLDPWLYRGGGKWEYHWKRGDKLPIFDTKFGKIGILICSEVYVPELTRKLAKQGAILIVYPTGLTSSDSPLIDTWKTVVWARAIENLCVTVVTSNSTGRGGLSMICTPENVLLNTEEEGVHIREIDLSRIELIRNSHDNFIGKGPEIPFRAKPGVFMDWIRSDLEY
jgi:predicted amidohydrolase